MDVSQLTHVYIKDTGQILTYTPGYFYVKKAFKGIDAIVEMLAEGFIGRDPLRGENLTDKEKELAEAEKLLDEMSNGAQQLRKIGWQIEMGFIPPDCLRDEVSRIAKTLADKYPPVL